MNLILSLKVLFFYLELGDIYIIYGGVFIMDKVRKLELIK